MTCVKTWHGNAAKPMVFSACEPQTTLSIPMQSAHAICALCVGANDDDADDDDVDVDADVVVRTLERTGTPHPESLSFGFC